MFLSLYGLSYTCKKEVPSNDTMSIVLLVYAGFIIIVLIMLFNHTPAVIIPVVVIAIITILMMLYCLCSCCCENKNQVIVTKTPLDDVKDTIASLDNATLKILQDEQDDIPVDDNHKSD